MSDCFSHRPFCFLSFPSDPAGFCRTYLYAGTRVAFHMDSLTARTRRRYERFSKRAFNCARPNNAVFFFIQFVDVVINDTYLSPAVYARVCLYIRNKCGRVIQQQYTYEHCVRRPTYVYIYNIIKYIITITNTRARHQFN